MTRTGDDDELPGRDRLLDLSRDRERRARPTPPDQRGRHRNAWQQIALVGLGHQALRGPQALGANVRVHLIQEDARRPCLRGCGQVQADLRGRRPGPGAAELPGAVVTYCSGGVSVSDKYIAVSSTIVKRVEVAPDGRFAGRLQGVQTTTIVCRRPRHGKVTNGKVDLSLPPCSGARSFKATKR